MKTPSPEGDARVQPADPAHRSHAPPATRQTSQARTGFAARDSESQPCSRNGPGVSPPERQPCWPRSLARAGSYSSEREPPIGMPTDAPIRSAPARDTRIDPTDIQYRCPKELPSRRRAEHRLFIPRSRPPDPPPCRRSGATRLRPCTLARRSAQPSRPLPCRRMNSCGLSPCTRLKTRENWKGSMSSRSATSRTSR